MSGAGDLAAALRSWQAVPHRRLALCYFLFFANVGVYLPYWSLYLEGEGFTPAQIGQLLAIALATRLFAPFLWGWLSDHYGRPLAVSRLGGMAGLLTFTAVWWSVGDVIALALVLLLYNFFWNAVLSPLEVTTLNHLSQHPTRYGRIRSWGSLGFIATVMLLGEWVASWGHHLIPVAMLVTMIALVAALLALPAPPAPALSSGVADRPGRLAQVLRQRSMIALGAAALLTHASHGPLYGFLSIHLIHLGYGASVGLFWAVGVIAEIAIFLALPQLLARFSHRQLLLATMALTTLRWGLLATAAVLPPLLLLAQALHAFSFGVHHAISIALIHAAFRGPLQGRGQALYSCISFGLGGALGALLAGYAWSLGGALMSFGGAAVLSSMALVVVWWGIRPPSGETVNSNDGHFSQPKAWLRPSR